MGQRNAIEVRDLEKSFRVPTHRVDTLKERALHPLRRIEYRQLHALRGISFNVAGGEFFGIVGRNGSGKTTLLKLLASIYRADGGSIKVAGPLSPFIELGVGFNPNMTARDNVLLNGVMLGLTPRQAHQRFDEVIEFAELEEFVEMKLKNYSSGMWVRLGFSLMIQADAEVLLIDEVLAVGDASFQKKCTDTFERLSKEGKTIVFVTHDMSAVQRFCDRAMLLDEGQVVEIGSAPEVAQRYLDINLPRHRPGADRAPSEAVDARIADVWVDDGTGGRAEMFARGERIYLNAVIQSEHGIEGPAVSFEFRNQEGIRVYASHAHEIGGPGGRLRAGERRHVRVSVENPLASGRYRINWALYRNGDPTDTVELATDPAGLTVTAKDAFMGVVELDPEWSVESDRAPDLARR
jgi:ABC-type polysaccharide/polyol phosphate transport system ATPase subunit